MLNSFFNIIEFVQTIEIRIVCGLQSEVRINLTRTCSEREKRGKHSGQSRVRTAGSNAVAVCACAVQRRSWQSH